MKTFFKYTGGKQKEVKNIKKFFPINTERVIEPFCGAASVSFNFELPSIVSDLDDNVTNLFNCVKDTTLYNALQEKIKNTNISYKDISKNKEHLRDLYYHYRDDMFNITDPLEKSYRFLLLRQLCFSGMTRINKDGKSNVPFGWYKYFQTRLDDNHNLLLQNWKIFNQDFELTIDMATDRDWLFLDPPYFKRNSKYGINSDAGSLEDIHKRLANKLCKVNSKWLLIHSDCQLYRDLYKDYNIIECDHKYMQNFKGKAIKNSKVVHLYIMNY